MSPRAPLTSALLLLFATGCPGAEDPVDTATTLTDADADGFNAQEDDCDDTNADIHPDAVEACDGVDNNCDDAIDESGSTAATWYADADGDTHGDALVSTVACDLPTGHVAVSDDCNDADPEIHPGATEECDSVDNNCDGTVDESGSTAATWYADTDGDTYGDPLVTTVACDLPLGHVSDATDCDDTSMTTFPGAVEECDDLDNNCDTVADEGLTVSTWYADTDGDGFGDASSTVDDCGLPAGYTADDTDCDDTDALVDSCFTRFDGTFGDAWESLGSLTTSGYALQTYHLRDTSIYNMSSPAAAYDPESGAWTSLSTPAFSRPWFQMAPWNGDLWGIGNNLVYQYDVATDTWAIVAAVTGGDDYNMTESDEYGMLYGYVQSGNIVIYDTLTGTVSYVRTGLDAEWETRIAYDPTGPALYFGSYATPNLYRYDILTDEITARTSIPEAQLNDIFCSDRAGHIYAAGGSSGTTLFQYTTATDSWTSIPDLPADHGNSMTCTVSADGWLYVVSSGNQLYRLELY